MSAKMNPHCNFASARGFVHSLSDEQRSMFYALFSNMSDDQLMLVDAIKQVEFLNGETHYDNLGYSLLAAVQYALPRMTSITFVVTNEVRSQWDNLTAETQNLIADTVSNALEAEQVGMSCDRELWTSLVEFAQTAKADRPVIPR